MLFSIQNIHKNSINLIVFVGMDFVYIFIYHFHLFFTAAQTVVELTALSFPREMT